MGKKSVDKASNKNKTNDKPAALETAKPNGIIAAQRFAGPLPPPEVFKQYGNVIPDAPERILKVFEEDSKHTRDMQRKALEAETKRDLRAQWMAFLVMFGTLGVLAIAVVSGNVTNTIVSAMITMLFGLKVLFQKNRTQ